MRAIFGRKINNLKELQGLTDEAKKPGVQGQTYTVTREVYLKDNEFRMFSNDLLNDQDWISSEDGGINQNGEVCCIRVINIDSDERVLVNSEGYSYPRYTAVEKGEK